MHFYGGGYTDIKPHTQTWRPLFKALNQTPSAIALGYPENKSKDIAFVKHFTPPQQQKETKSSHGKTLSRNYWQLRIHFQTSNPLYRIMAFRMRKKIISVLQQSQKKIPATFTATTPDIHCHGIQF